MRLPSIVAVAALLAANASGAQPPTESAVRYIVQASSVERARKDVEHVGGVVERDLGIIHAVTAQLDSRQLERLRHNSEVNVFETL